MKFCYIVFTSDVRNSTNVSLEIAFPLASLYLLVPLLTLYKFFPTSLSIVYYFLKPPTLLSPLKIFCPLHFLALSIYLPYFNCFILTTYFLLKKKKMHLCFSFRQRPLTKCPIFLLFHDMT